MPAARERARQDTWGRLLAPARPACTPAPALRRSHFPDPPPATLRQERQSILLVVPGALHQHRPAAAVKRSLLDDGEDRCTLSRPGMTPLDTEGSHDRITDITRMGAHAHRLLVSEARAEDRGEPDRPYLDPAGGGPSIPRACAPTPGVRSRWPSGTDRATTVDGGVLS